VITEITNINGARENSAKLLLTRDALCWLARYAVALVWAYNGLYCKLFQGDISHLQVFASLPFIPLGCTLVPFMALGLFEAFLAGWVIWGRAPRMAALVQTLLLLAMNAGGLVWGLASIEHPGAMVVQNLSFLVLVWLAATKGDADERAYA
jgi:uncharacterized membrane protein YphA (DoxX/SURF4 family)